MVTGKGWTAAWTFSSLISFRQRDGNLLVVERDREWSRQQGRTHLEQLTFKVWVDVSAAVLDHVHRKIKKKNFSFPQDRGSGCGRLEEGQGICRGLGR